MREPLLTVALQGNVLEETGGITTAFYINGMCFFTSYLISRCRNFAASSLARILNLKRGNDAKLTAPVTKGKKWAFTIKERFEIAKNLQVATKPISRQTYPVFHWLIIG